MKPYRSLILKGWWAVLLVLFVSAVLLGRHVPDLEVNAGTAQLLNEDDPDLAFYERTRPMWGYDEYAMVCVTRDTWFDEEGVALLERIVADLEAIPHVDRVLSLFSIPLLGQGPGPVPDLSKKLTLNSENIDLKRAEEELRDHELALGNLISADGRSLSILVYLTIPEDIPKLDPEWVELRMQEDRTPEIERRLAEILPRLEAASKVLAGHRELVVDRVRELAKEYGPELPEPVRLSGLSLINISIKEHLNHDLSTFGIAAFVLFTLGFLVIYRRTRFVVMPILTCLLPVALVLGAMSLWEMKLTVVTANLPVLLFTLMLPYTVYFVERYRERRSLFPDEPGHDSTFEAANKIWIPCLFSCATTIAGFLALLTSRTKPVHDFGKMTAAGMAAGLVIVFLAIPCMSRPLKAMRVEGAGGREHASGLVAFFERITLRAPGVIAVMSAVVLGLSIWGASRLSAQSKFTEYFKSESEVYQGLEYIDQQVGGTTPLEVILEAKEPLFFLKPKGLAALEAVEAYFEGVAEVGNVRSLARAIDEVKSTAPALLPMVIFGAKTPTVREVTADLADEDYRIARVLVRLRETAPTLDRNVILEGLRAHLKAAPELKDLEVRETGVFLLYANMLNSLMATQQETFLYVVVAIYLMLIVLFRSPVLSLLLLLTQVLPAVVMLGVMGWSGIPLDIITVMIAAIAMGIGIDAAIQYTFRYRRELAVDGDHRAALSRTHATIGRAIWIATSVIIAGFCVLALSQFRPSIYFGLFTGLAMLMSQLAALTVLPSIFLLTGYPKVRVEAEAARSAWH